MNKHISQNVELFFQMCLFLVGNQASSMTNKLTSSWYICCFLIILTPQNKYNLEKLTFHLITQVLRLMTTFLVGTPSVLWHHRVAGLTSPAWVKFPLSAAEEEEKVWGSTANRSWRGQETTLTPRARNLNNNWPGHLSASIFQLLLCRFFTFPLPSFPKTRS